MTTEMMDDPVRIGESNRGQVFRPGDWAWSVDHEQTGRVVETQTLWGDSICRMWIPAKDAVVRVRSNRLRSVGGSAQGSAFWLSYVVAAARVSDALTGDSLLAPIEAPVRPLPHQVRALQRVAAGDRVRYLLADEVGLGKTIEAGLIMRELKLRGVGAHSRFPGAVQCVGKDGL